MPAPGTKKYVVTAHPFAVNKTKGFHKWEQKAPATKEDEPQGDQVIVAVGGFVYLTPEAAAPLVKIGRLQPASEG